jgi:hypothetical protein
LKLSGPKQAGEADHEKEVAPLKEEAHEQRRQHHSYWIPNMSREDSGARVLGHEYTMVHRTSIFAIRIADEPN